MLNLSGIQEISAEMQQCIQNCLECHSSCLATIPHCLKMGGKHAAPEHITLLYTCAEICQTSANFMLVNSPMHGRTCAVCAELCERCGQECESMANGDQHMLACAQICRRCAESCRQMAMSM
jgi:hypothetical protein